MALAAALWFDKIAAFTLAAIAIIYLVFVFDLITRHTAGAIADIGFLVAMVIGIINGPSEGLLAGNAAFAGAGSVDHGRHVTASKGVHQESAN